MMRQYAGLSKRSRLIIKWTALSVLGLYLLATVLAGVFQRSLIYHPWSDRPVTSSGFHEVALPLPEGNLLAWYRPAMAGKETVVFFDGNAGSLSGAVRITSGLADAGYGLLLVSYPGYDGNPGHPSEQSLYAAGRAALAWLDGHEIGRPVILGYSLGTGVATQMALEHRSQALILMAPFASMTRMATIYLPLLPTDLLLRDRYENSDKITALHTPLLIAQGDADRTIPIAEGRRLFDAANQPKRFVIISGAGHLLTLSPIIAQLEVFLGETR